VYQSSFLLLYYGRLLLAFTRLVQRKYLAAEAVNEPYYLSQVGYVLTGVWLFSVCLSVSNFK